MALVIGLQHCPPPKHGNPRGSSRVNLHFLQATGLWQYNLGSWFGASSAWHELCVLAHRPAGRCTLKQQISLTSFSIEHWYSPYKRRRFENRSDQTFCILLIKDVLSVIECKPLPTPKFETKLIRKLRLTFCTIEANYWQTRSIATAKLLVWSKLTTCSFHLRHCYIISTSQSWVGRGRCYHSFTSCSPIHPPPYQMSIPTSINFGDMGVQKLTKWGLLIP